MTKTVKILSMRLCKYALILLFTGICASKAQAQDDEWHGATITVHGTYPAQATSSGTGNGYTYGLYNAVELGGDVGYQFNDTWSVHLGFNWNQTKASARNIDAAGVAGQPTFYPSIPYGYMDIYEIPLTVKAVILKYIFIQGGVFYDIQKKTEVYAHTGTNGPFTDQSGIGIVLNPGFTIPLSKGLNLNASFNNEFHGIHINNNNLSGQKVYFSGLQLGLTARL